MYCDEKADPVGLFLMQRSTSKLIDTPPLNIHRVSRRLRRQRIILRNPPLPPPPKPLHHLQQPIRNDEPNAQRDQVQRHRFLV